MKKALLPLALLAAMPFTAAAETNISIYGRAHVSVDHLMMDARSGSASDDYSETNLSSNASRLGFKGSHDISPNLKAFFQVEQQINFTSGNSEGGSDLATRDTFVGLSGDFGKVQVGRFDSPFKKARGPANLFGDQLGDMRNLARVGDGRFDERYDNTVQYTTPNYSGFTAALAYSVHEGVWVEDDTDTDSISMSLNYTAGAFEGSLAYEAAEEDTRRGERDAIRAAAAYKITDAIKLVGFYQTIDYEGGTPAKQDELTSDTYGVGGEFKIASNTALKAMWMSRDADAEDHDAEMWVVGIEHKLDKAVRVYANFAMIDNDDNSRLVPWYQARTTANNLTADYTGEDSSGFSVGLRYDF